MQNGYMAFGVMDGKFALDGRGFDILQIGEHRFEPIDYAILPLVFAVGAEVVPQVSAVM
jgi:hypothetical protein